MTDPYARLAHIARVLARPMAVAVVRGCSRAQTLADMGARFQRGESSIRATLGELLSIGAVTKPEGSYLERALEAGEMNCQLPAMLRALAEELEGVG